MIIFESSVIKKYKKVLTLTFRHSVYCVLWGDKNENAD